MREILAIRHVGFEHLGTLAPILSGRGYRVRYADAGINDLGNLDAQQPALLVVLGAPIGANDEHLYPFLRAELALIRQRLASERPLLGICLGAQLMAKALGAPVYPGSAREIGWSPIQLTPAGAKSCLAELQDCNFQVPHWHGDTFDLPEDAQRLASTPITPNQGFSLGPKVLGLQFHLELDPAELERWLIGHALEIASTAGIDAPSLRAATDQHGPALTRAAHHAWRRWLTDAGL